MQSWGLSLHFKQCCKMLIQNRITFQIQLKFLQDIFMFLFALKQKRVLFEFLRLKNYIEIKVKNGPSIVRNKHIH